MILSIVLKNIKLIAILIITFLLSFILVSQNTKLQTKLSVLEAKKQMIEDLNKELQNKIDSIYKKVAETETQIQKSKKIMSWN
jgi:peptidoglycan hydrolase CwlO-like protein